MHQASCWLLSATTANRIVQSAAPSNHKGSFKNRRHRQERPADPAHGSISRRTPDEHGLGGGSRLGRNGHRRDAQGNVQADNSDQSGINDNVVIGSAAQDGTAAVNSDQSANDFPGGGAPAGLVQDSRHLHLDDVVRGARLSGSIQASASDRLARSQVAGNSDSCSWPRRDRDEGRAWEASGKQLGRRDRDHGRVLDRTQRESTGCRARLRTS
jgi:hypothetical protein